MSVTNYKSEESSKYSEISLQGEGTLFLSFRDLELLIHKHFGDVPLRSIQAIDYGCGAGRSTRYLKSLGIDHVDGFDISNDMIQQAMTFDSFGRYEVIQSGQLPVADASYNLALLSFVTVAIEHQEELLRAFQEVARVLKRGGQMLSLTLSEVFWNPQRKWISYKQDYPENYSPKSGQKSRLTITSCNLELTDCYWSESDMIEMAKQAGLSLKEIHYPLGKKVDGINWHDEDKFPPYSIFNFCKM